MQVSLSDVSYSVDIKGARKQPSTTKVILNKISATFRSGRLTALMGASGAGKTSLLNLLASEVMAGHIEGCLQLNGRPVRPDALKKLSGFVFQDDVILDTATVREAVTMSATLRLPKTMSLEDKLQRVDNVLKLLHLEKCADTVIGNALVKGVSGGERKRCSVAMELVTDPPLLFLDEPTSGLDTFTASSLIHSLQQLARSGRTVIATIHQPSSEIFHNFDDLVLLASGKVVYAGEAESAVEYFSKIGFPCPQYTNPADHFFMEVLNEAGAGTVDPAQRGKMLADSWESLGADWVARSKALALASPKATNKSTVFPEASTPDGVMESPQHEAGAGFWEQFKLLFRRAFRNQLRNKLLLRGRLMQTLVMAVMVSLIYLNVRHDQRGVQDRQGFLFFIVANGVMGASMGVVSTFHGERTVFTREHRSRMYSLPSYFLSKTTVELPALLLLPLIGATILYWLVGLQPDAGKFFIFAVTMILMSTVGTSIGMFVATLFEDVSQALQLLPLFLMPLMLFSGYMVNDDSIPVYFIWLKYLSPMKYGLTALVKNEFNGLTLTCTDAELKTAAGGQSVCPFTSGDQVVKAMSMDDDLDIWSNLIVLLTLYLALQAMSFFALWRIGSRRANVTYDLTNAPVAPSNLSSTVAYSDNAAPASLQQWVPPPPRSPLEGAPLPMVQELSALSPRSPHGPDSLAPLPALQQPSLSPPHPGPDFLQHPNQHPDLQNQALVAYANQELLPYSHAQPQYVVLQQAEQAQPPHAQFQHSQSQTPQYALQPAQHAQSQTPQYVLQPAQHAQLQQPPTWALPVAN